MTDIMTVKGVADPNEEAYMKSICSTRLCRSSADSSRPTQISNAFKTTQPWETAHWYLEVPSIMLQFRISSVDAMCFEEWGLPTQFNATDEFLFKWADAQKLAYSKGAGWIVSRFRWLLGI